MSSVSPLRPVDWGPEPDHEKALLEACTDPTSVDWILETFRASDFATRHALIFNVVRQLRDAGAVPDFVTIRELLRDVVLDGSITDDFLSDIAGKTPRTCNLRYHGGQVLKARAQKAFAAGDYDEGKRHDARRDALLAKSTPQIGLFDPYTSGQARTDAITAGEGISTGIASLDAGGFHLRAGNVWTFAARQGGGKTSLLLETTMRHVETEHDACALFTSFEGSRYELYMRLLLRQVALGRVEDGQEPGAPYLADATRWLKTGRVFDREAKHDSLASEWEAELEAAALVLDGHLEAHRLVLIDGDDVPNADGGEGVTASRIMDALRLAPRRPTLAVFDYWQKLTPANRTDTRYMQLAETADRLRRYAKGDGDPAQSVVVLTAAQVNRGATGQPGLENIRESDDLGNDGAGVVTLYLQDSAEPVKKMRLQVVKNRFGPCGGRAELMFYGSCGYFAETDTESERSARVSKTRARIRADVERIYAKDPTTTVTAVREAVRGKGVTVSDVYHEVFGVE